MSADRDIELLMRFRHELPIHVVPYYETFDVGRAMQLG